ncbi:MAG: TrkH family potassium uptake protein [Leptospirales bacterium]|nr:TrkH family potassium uptake protein [Leptospirales bacterium]
MNIKIILRMLSVILVIISGFMIIPAFIAVLYNEINSLFAILITIGISIAIYFIIKVLPKKENVDKITHRDGFLFVSLSWAMASLIGALPFYISGAIPHFADAYFEAMSGFTTTGATILSNVEALPVSLLFWRALTHWLGGMGIVVLTVAVLPVLGIKGLQLIAAEAPGSKIDKLTARVAETAKILWIIYFVLTVIVTVLLLIGGMPLIDALTHALSTVSTGGYSIRNSSIAYYNSPYIETVITCFMVICGINFSLHFWVVSGSYKNFLKDSELKGYLAIFFIATLIITSQTFGKNYNSITEAFRYASFQVASIMTTTGFATADYEQWSFLSRTVLFVLMFVGGCSGSTSGGVKVIRLVTLLKQGLHEMKYLLHPRGVFLLRINDKPVKKDMVYAISGFFFMYILFTMITTLIVSSSEVDFETSFGSALAAIGNVGPGLGKVGPNGNYGFFPSYVKLWLSFAMLVGRLELYTVLIIFTRDFWKR